MGSTKPSTKLLLWGGRTNSETVALSRTNSGEPMTSAKDVQPLASCSDPG